MKRIIVICLLAFVAVSVGCSSGNVGLKGTVVFTDDKTPVPNGIICFDSGTINARGTIKSDGTFVMGSLKETDGLPPGDYRVFFIDVQEQTGERTGAPGDASEPVYTSLIDSKYLSPDRSGLTANVTKDTKTLSFELDRNPNTKR
ncbi:MAG: hypothetical protein FWH27_05585 [Planctomycetaceae bacterium]|nr:hypothetical protein [Planctomycetaceae bacterium]